MLSGFGDLFSNLFTSQKREDYIKQIEQTKERISQSRLTAAKKQIFLAVIAYASSSKNNFVVNRITGDSEIDAERKLLNKVFALSKLNDEQMLLQMNTIVNELPKDNEFWKKLSTSINDTNIELKQHRQSAYYLSGVVAALGSLMFAYYHPLAGTLVIAAEMAAAYQFDLKPYINEAAEMFECGTIIEAIVDGPEKTRESLAMKTFKA